MFRFYVFPSNGAPVEWNWQGKTEVLGEKPVPVPLCLPQIPHGLTRDRTRASAVRWLRQLVTHHSLAFVCENSVIDKEFTLRSCYFLSVSLHQCSILTHSGLSAYVRGAALRIFFFLRLKATTSFVSLQELGRNLTQWATHSTNTTAQLTIIPSSFPKLTSLVFTQSCDLSKY
jgi:hypothetical protein